MLNAMKYQGILVALCTSMGGQAGTAEKGPAEGFADMPLQDLVSLDVFSSASLLPTQISRAPGTVYSFHRSQFNRFGVRRLEDLLQFVPGFQLNQYRKRHRALWARGLLQHYNSKLVLMVDGVRRQHLYYGHFSLGDNFPLEMVEKVEIILGPATSLYGANAFGGMISVTTRDFADQPKLELSLNAGDNQRSKTTAFYNSDGWQAFGSYLTQDAPFSEDRKSFIGLDVLQPLDEQYQTLSLKARPLPGLTLKLNYSESETPFLFIPTSQDAFVDKSNLSIALSYEVGDLDSGKFEIRTYYQRDKTREYEKEQLTRALGYEEFQNANLGGVSVTGFKRWQVHTLAAGVTWNREKAENTRYERRFHWRDGFLDPVETGYLLADPELENNDYAFFLQDVWDINPQWSLTLGGRFDQFDQFDEYFNYRAALVHTPDTRQTWKLLYGTAIRTPTLREYLKVLEGTSFKPPVPDAERMKTLELGYQYQWEKADLSLNLFQNNMEDFIREMPTPDEEDEYYANSEGTLRLHGAEMLLNASPLQNLQVRFGLAYLNSEGTELGRMPYLASWSTSLNLNYNYHSKHSIGLSLVHNDSRSDTNSFADDDADSFVVANLHGSGEISKTLSYTFGIDNLFNSQVYDPAADFGWQYNPERNEREIWMRLQWTPAF